MKELDDFFIQNLEFFENIFANIDYIAHQGTNKNDVNWLWRSGGQFEFSGITDVKGNYFYIRYKDENSSFRQKQNDKTGVRWVSDLRAVGILHRAVNSTEIAQNIAYKFSKNHLFNDVKVNLNTLQVYADEVGSRKMINTSLDLFSIDFSAEISIQDCKFNLIRPMINLGEFSHCDTVDLGVASDLVGNYVLRQTFNGQLIDIEIEITNAGDNLTFLIPETELNENYTYETEIVSVPFGSGIDTTNIFRYTVKPKI